MSGLYEDLPRAGGGGLLRECERNLNLEFLIPRRPQPSIDTSPCAMDGTRDFELSPIPEFITMDSYCNLPKRMVSEMDIPFC